MSDREYCYPPDFTTLRNKLNIRDLPTLEAAERQFVAQRLLEAVPRGDFDLEHLKAIHRHTIRGPRYASGPGRHSVNSARRSKTSELRKRSDGHSGTSMPGGDEAPHIRRGPKQTWLAIRNDWSRHATDSSYRSQGSLGKIPSHGRERQDLGDYPAWQDDSACDSTAIRRSRSSPASRGPFSQTP